MDEQAFEARLFRGDHVYGIPSFARISACGGRKIRYFMVPWPQCHSDYDAFEIKRVLMGSKTSCFESCLDCYLPVDDMEVVVCPADSDVKVTASLRWDTEEPGEVVVNFQCRIVTWPPSMQVLVHYEPVVMHIGYPTSLFG